MNAEMLWPWLGVAGQRRPQRRGMESLRSTSVDSQLKTLSLL
jgi:hypothetical protein